MIRVLIADDHTVVRDGLRAILAAAPDIELVGEAATGAEALTLAARLDPDVVLMDLRMPDTDGATATATLHRRQPHARVLVLTTYDTDADITRATAAGAVGYLLKDATRADLLAGIRAAARGESALAPRVASRLLHRMRTPAPAALSTREIDILRLVAVGRSNPEIARALHLSLSTIKTHLVHIFTKLGVDDRTGAVTAAAKAGYLHLDP